MQILLEGAGTQGAELKRTTGVSEKPPTVGLPKKMRAQIRRAFSEFDTVCGLLRALRQPMMHLGLTMGRQAASFARA